MARKVELRRHTDNDGDVLSDEGVAAALALGRRLQGPYALAVSSGAQRATQTAACLLGAVGRSASRGVTVESGLRSEHEDRWRAIYGETGDGHLDSFRAADPDFVASEAATLGAALRRVLDRLGDGERALAIGHSPTNEAAVLGLTGTTIDPLGKGDGVLVVADDDGYHVDVLDDGDRFAPAAVTHLLVVADVAASRDFYVDVLGASVHRAYGGTSIVLDLSGTWVLLVTPGTTDSYEPDLVYAPPGDTTTLGAQVILRVDDAHAAYERLRARGARFLAAPVDRGGEVRAFLRDPDGHVIEISALT